MASVAVTASIQNVRAQEGDRPQGDRRPAFRDGDRPGDGQRGPRDGQGPRDGDGDRRFGPGGPGRGFRGPGGAPDERRGPEMLLRLPVIAALDTDGDGVISSEEISGAAESLKKLDRNRDGKIDLLEMRPAGGPPAGRGPGGPPEMRRFGDRGPGDRPDGGQPERQRGDRVPGDRILGDRAPGDRGALMRRPGDGDAAGGGRGFGPEAMLERLMQQDKDGDGALTAEELPPFMARLIERADSDADGKLSREELGKALALRDRGMRREGRPGEGRPGEGRPGQGRPGQGRDAETPGGERPKRPPLE